MSYYDRRMCLYKHFLVLFSFFIPLYCFAQTTSTQSITDFKYTFDWLQSLGIQGILLLVIGAMGWVIIKLALLYLNEAKDKNSRMDLAHKELIKLIERTVKIIEEDSLLKKNCIKLQEDMAEEKALKLSTLVKEGKE